MIDRTPVTTVEELESLDADEITAGYRDGFAGEPEPGDNRSKAYWHGWRNGHGDKTNTSDDAQRMLAREYVASKRLSDQAKGEAAA